MTLLELVIALTITGLMLSAGYATFATLADRRAVAAERADDVARAAALRRTLAGWLASARLTIEEDEIAFRGLDGVRSTNHETIAATTADLPDDDLTFLTTAPTPLGNGETLAHLYIDRTDQTPERGLVVELAEWRGTRRARVELDTTVAGLDVRYLSGVLGARQWLPSWVSTTVLPAGLELRLSAATTKDSLPPLLAVPITVAFGSGR
jgi:hypothetical protein